MTTRFELKLRLSRPQKKAQTRDELLDAAGRVFARRGYEAATLDEVADAAGYTKGALYSNFSSKEALFLALIERRVGTMGARVTGSASTAPDTAPGAPARPETAADDEQSQTVDQRAWSLEWLMLAMEFWLYAMRHDQARELMAAQYERFRGIASLAIEQRAEELGVQLPMPARELVILSEAIGTGLGIQHALDPEKVDQALQRAAVNRLVGFEVLPPRE